MRVQFLRWLEEKEDEIIDSWVHCIKSSPHTPIFSHINEKVLKLKGKLFLDLWLDTNFKMEDCMGWEECQEFHLELSNSKAKLSEIFALLAYLATSISASLSDFPHIEKLPRGIIRKTFEDISHCFSECFICILNDIIKKDKEIVRNCK